jgi:hypothetical protein
MPTLELRIHFRAHGFRWPLADIDVVELWQGLDYRGQLSGRAIRSLVEHHVAAAALTETIHRELAAAALPARKPPRKRHGR